MKMHKIAVLSSSLIFLAGCSSMVKFDSSPQGASVTCTGCKGWGNTDTATPIGVTPFEYEVKDNPGWYSEYTFTAVKDGYKPATVKVNEKNPLDGTSFEFFPKNINFDLQK